MSPAQFRQQAPDDQALMIAYDMFVERCEAYRFEHMEDRRKQQEDIRSGKTTGSNPYERLLDGWGIKR